MQPLRSNRVHRPFRMKSLTDRWTSWLEQCSFMETGLLSLKFIQDCALRDLRNDGFQVPPQKRVLASLVVNLPPLEPTPSPAGPPVHWCAQFHLLNLLWLPVVKYIESLSLNLDEPEPKVHQELLLLEMEGIIASPEEVLSTDAWVEYLQDTIRTSVSLEVPSRLIKK